LDRIDQRLIECLREDARASFVVLGAKLGLSEAAVRRRVKNLIKSGIIRRFTVDVEASQVASALTLVGVSPGLPTSEVANRIKNLPSVRKVNEITGEYDIAITIEGFNMAEMNSTIDQIRRMPGVSSTNTMVILREVT
jgi:DNA-binding Lrp family transcriptional regulator